MTRSWRELTQCDVEKKKKKIRLHTYIVYFPHSLKKMLLTSQSHLPHAAFFVAAKSLLPQGKSSRHQTEAGNVLLCLEDEPYKGRAFFKKNTVHYCNFISSQSLNHSSHPNPKNKTLLRFPKFPAGRSREKKQRSLFGSLCFVIELLDVLIERTYVIF